MSDYLNKADEFLTEDEKSKFGGKLTEVVGQYDAVLGALVNSRENPFATSKGQIVTSSSENNIQRLFRMATTVKYGAVTDNATLSGTNQAGVIYTPAAGFALHAVNMTGSATVDCLITIVLDQASSPYNMRVIKRAFVKAGTELSYKSDGELFASSAASQVLKFLINPTASGTFYGSLYGVEIAENA
jgi:hypothetical protein